MPAKKKRDTPSSSHEGNDYWQKKTALDKKKVRLFNQTFFHDWCKGCGICIAFCPKKIIFANKNDKPCVKDPDKCTGCRFCELHCPDFAITITESYPDRRKKPDDRE